MDILEVSSPLLVFFVVFTNFLWNSVLFCFQKTQVNAWKQLIRFSPFPWAGIERMWEGFENSSEGHGLTSQGKYSRRIHCLGGSHGVVAEFPRWLSGKESACQCRRHKSCGFNLWVRKIPPETEMATCSSIHPWKIHGQRSLVGYGPWGRKESDTTEGHTHARCGSQSGLRSSLSRLCLLLSTKWSRSVVSDSATRGL